MNKLMWLCGASLTLYFVSGQRTITEEMGWLAFAAVIVIVLVVLSLLPGIRSRKGRVKLRTFVGIHKIPRVEGLGWLFGYDIATISQEYRVDGDSNAVKEVTGKDPELYGWVPTGGVLGGYVPKEDIDPSWGGIAYGAIAAIVIAMVIFAIVLLIASSF